jgi:hypothetical protein
MMAARSAHGTKTPFTHRVKKAILILHRKSAGIIKKPG